MPTVPVILTEWDERVIPIDPEIQRAVADLKTRDLIENLNRSDMLAVQVTSEGICLKTTTYIGQFDLGQLRVQIIPKLMSESIIDLIQYAFDLRSYTGSQKCESLLIGEILAQQLLIEGIELVGRGLYRNYQEVEGEVNNPKGKIDLQKTALSGGATKKTVICRYYSLSEDCLINQVLKSGLRLAIQTTEDQILKVKLRRLVDMLMGIRDIRIDRNITEKMAQEKTG